MVGRSNIVGLPVSLLLLKEDATVTIVHSRTKEPETIIRNADIIIAAAGQAAMVTRESYRVVTAFCSVAILILLSYSIFRSRAAGLNPVLQ